jgi:hypothetical protein
LGYDVLKAGFTKKEREPTVWSAWQVMKTDELRHFNISYEQGKKL